MCRKQIATFICPRPLSAGMLEDGMGLSGAQTWALRPAKAYRLRSCFFDAPSGCPAERRIP
jgi:hypothetical protein